jgi:hypothetical protein
LQAKIFQAHQANKHCSKEPTFEARDKAMLSVLHW